MFPPAHAGEALFIRPPHIQRKWYQTKAHEQIYRSRRSSGYFKLPGNTFISKNILPPKILIPPALRAEVV